MKTYFGQIPAISVLQYVRSAAKRYKTFVANRIAAIQAWSEPSRWRHVFSESNPADIASRGVMPEQFLMKDQWFIGPDFVWQNESQ